jgi:hypothetical protein
MLHLSPSLRYISQQKEKFIALRKQCYHNEIHLHSGTLSKQNPSEEKWMLSYSKQVEEYFWDLEVI